MSTNKVSSLLSKIIFLGLIVTVIGHEITENREKPPDIYAKGDYLAIRLLGSIVCFVLGLTFCFSGRDVVPYVVFFASVELFTSATLNLDLLISQVHENNYTVVLYSVFSTLTFILSVFAACSFNFGKIVLGINTGGSFWLFLNTLGLFNNKILGGILLLALCILGLILPFFYPEATVIISTASVGSTFLMFGVDLLADTGFIFFAYDPFYDSNKVHYRILVLIISSYVVGFTGILVQNYNRDRREKHRNIVMLKD